MSLRSRLFQLACAAIVAAGISSNVPSAHAATIMAIGDSITYGVGSPSTGGYLQHLQALLPASYSLIGPQQTLIPPDNTTPYAGSWNHHFGFPGIEADAPGSSLVTQATSQNLFSSYNPDILLLHIGTNTLDIDNASSDDARDQLSSLLDYLGQNLSSNTQILLAKIIPKTNRNSGDSGVSKPTIFQTRRYNNYIDTLVSSLTNADPLFGRINVVDMFAIDLSDPSLGLTTLLNDPAVNPEPNDNYVDWITDFNEAPNGGDPGINRARNTNLLADALHPTSLGYDIMAHVWYQGLVNANLIPEPTSAALCSLGVAALLLRRRRPA
jgi:hypothetical protein